MAAQARLAEMDADEREGQLLPLESFRQILGQIVGELRARITAFPGKYAPRSVGLKSIAQAQLLLEEVSNEFLTALRTVGGEIRDAETRRSQRAKPRRRGSSRQPSAGA